MRRKRRYTRKVDNVKAFTRKYSKFFKHMFSVFVIFSTIYVLHEILFISNIFKIRDVLVEGNSTYLNLDDLAYVTQGAAVGKNIFTLESYKLAEVLSKTFLVAEHIDIQKKLPNKIIVNVKERTPVAVVKSDDEYIVDTEGFVLGIADESFESFPRIDYGDNVLVGRFLDKNMIPIGMEILDSADVYGLDISSMSFSEKYATIHLAKGEEVLLSNEKSISKSMEIVSALLKKLGIEGKSVSKIDLRYDKVVVSY